LSTPEELEQLQTARTRLEEEHQTLEEQQKNLELRTKILEEKITIEELKRDNKSKNEAISQLKSKLDGLDQRLSSMLDTTSAPSFEPKQELVTTEVVDQVTETEAVVTETQTEEHEEDNVTVTALENPAAPEQEEVGFFNKQHEKKKRKLFY
jgi:hypothetical protein